MKELITYARTEERIPTGCFVARKVDDGTVRVGWSARTKNDPLGFTKTKALDIARARITTGTKLHIPYRLQDILPGFKARCQKYFRTDLIVVIQA